MDSISTLAVSSIYTHTGYQVPETLSLDPYSSWGLSRDLRVSPEVVT